MQKTFLIAATIFGGLALAFGAFGAHALKAKISAEHLQIFETGVRYQFYHALALILLALAFDKISVAPAQIAGYSFIIGIMLFSGSIYLLATRELLGIDSWKSILGPLTPLGGLCLFSGWVFFLIAALKGFK
ncbi:MAG: DUF423 domain-containing protein [Bacteroidetes bacterium]|nr:MAG: DUF423 domain-containing protein [Bacteroidota bacterium]